MRPGLIRRRARAAAVALAVLGSGLLIPSVARADSTLVTGARLSHAMYGTGAVWTGQYSYIFGGYAYDEGAYSSDIIRYDPATNVAQVVAHLPAAGRTDASVWTGQYVYLFGGVTSAGDSDKIIRFDPATHAVATMATHLPSARFPDTAAFDGTYAWIFGGYTINQILRYDPATDSITVSPTHLPVYDPCTCTPTAYKHTLHATFTGQFIDMFGGWAEHCTNADCPNTFKTITRFDPVTQSLVELPTLLATRLDSSSVVFDGTSAYIVGGFDETYSTDNTGRGYLDTIIRWDPVAQTLTTLPNKLTSGRWGHSAVIRNSKIDVFGGVTWIEQCCVLDDIETVDLTAGTASWQGRMPTTRSGSSAVWTGTYGYVFGGTRHSWHDHWEDPDNEILRYDPATGGTILESAHFPTCAPSSTASVTESSAVWTGTYAYVFGGGGFGGSKDCIYRYDPVTDTVTTMTAKLPSVATATSAIWTGTYAYIFGGRPNSGADLNTIIRYDPVTDTVTKMNAKLPAGRAYTSAVWTGTRALIFGGYPSNGSNIASYDPILDTIALTGATIPEIDADSAAVWDGTRALLFGGLKSGTGFYDTIYSYDPVSNQLVLRDAKLPNKRRGMSAFITGNSVYLFGGCCTPSPDFAEYEDVLKYDVLPSPPLLQPVSGPARGQLGVTWTAPGANAYRSPITGYHVFQGATPTSLASVSTLPATTLSYSVTGFADGAGQYFAVASINADGEGLPSAPVLANAPVKPSAPLSPVGTSGPGVGQITLTWASPANRGGTNMALQYKIYRGTSPSTETPLTTIGDVTTFTDTSQPPGQIRYYQISAVTAVGEGPRSLEVSAKAPVPPTAPRNLAASLVTQGQTKLTWQAPVNIGGPPTLAAYRLYRHDLLTGYTLLATLNGPYAYGSTTSYIDTTCALGSVCYYQVTAFNGAYEGPPSNEVDYPGTAIP